MRYSHIIGTGGIGKGVLYRLKGNHDLGREESRPAHLTGWRDFCKLHIVFNYVSVFHRDLGCKTKILPMSAVGRDEAGAEMLQLMQSAGIDARWVAVMKNTPTLFSFSYQYPDGSGGNITESESAAGQYLPSRIQPCVSVLEKAGKRALVVVAPEVPFETRARLLAMGRKHGAFNAASFSSSEMGRLLRSGLLSAVDLLSINGDEARALAGKARRADMKSVVVSCAGKVWNHNPHMRIAITDGKNGLHACQPGCHEHLPSLRVKVASTAGAGDATFAGLICGQSLGLPFSGGAGLTAARLARLFGAFSVTSPDTIHFGFSLKALTAFAKKYKEPFGFFGDCP